MTEPSSDLVVLVSDRNMEAAVAGLLARPQAMRIQPVRVETYVHPERDPGCLNRAHEFLRPWSRRVAHAMVLFDRHGCGRETESREALENVVMERLAAAGWDDRAEAVVLDPELEVWVWSDSPHVAACLGWRKGSQDLGTWLRTQGLWPEGHAKPPDPKAAAERALREMRKARSSALFRELAASVSFDRCVDPAFIKFRQVLCRWFGRHT